MSGLKSGLESDLVDKEDRPPTPPPAPPPESQEQDEELEGEADINIERTPPYIKPHNSQLTNHFSASVIIRSPKAQSP
jgi:hypothetical protein